MHHPWSSLLSLALLTTSTVSAPANTQSFKISRVGTGNSRTKNGVLQVEKVHRKYGWAVPEKLTEAANAAREKVAASSGGASVSQGVQKIALQQHQGTVGSITAVPQQYNSEYLCPISVGGQTLQLDIDTGSSDFWIYNTAVPSSEMGTHSVYDPSKSKTYQAVTDQNFNMSYGDKTGLSGNVAKEEVTIGSLTVDGQSIELPNSVSSGITADNSDGIVGLGFQSINSIQQNGKPDPQPTWFENVMPQLATPLFTANLKAGMAGYFKFGQLDNTAYKDGTIWYSKVDNSTGYWGFDSTRYAIGSGNTQTNSNSDSMAIADTGSSLFFVNPAPFNAFYANVNGHTTDPDTQLTTYPCSETLPDFHVSLGASMATIPGVLLNYMPDTKKGPSGEAMCVGGIQSNNGQAPQVYGDILFQAYFVVFDYGAMEIGFAPHA